MREVMDGIYTTEEKGIFDASMTGRFGNVGVQCSKSTLWRETSKERRETFETFRLVLHSKPLTKIGECKITKRVIQVPAGEKDWDGVQILGLKP
jgi:hypothetical protein